MHGWCLPGVADRSSRRHTGKSGQEIYGSRHSGRHRPEVHHWKLLTPDCRRRAVVALQEQFGVKERRACRVVGQPRSTQRLKPPVPSDDELALRAFLRDFSKRRPRWGWRRAAVEAEKGRVAGQPQADPPPLDRRRPACAL